MPNKTKESRDTNRFRIKKIVVAVDGSPSSLRAAQAAIEMSKHYGAELIVLHVIQYPTYHLYAPRAYGAAPVKELLDHSEKLARQSMEPILDEAKATGVSARLEILREKISTYLAIIQKATAEKADLIVVGTRGLGGFAKLLLGSVSSGVVAHATCPVLIIR